MSKDELLVSLSTEMRRGTVVLCALHLLQTPRYGYELVETMDKAKVPVEGNTLYPLLRRLEQQGLLMSEWNTEGAKPRKYYCITDFGGEVLAALTENWQTGTASIARLLKGEKDESTE